MARWTACAANVPSPNGITLSTTEQHCYVAVTRAQQSWRVPLMADGSVSKTGVAIELSGGVAGPHGVGVWRFNANMLPTPLVHSDGPYAGRRQADVRLTIALLTSVRGDE